LIKKKPVSVKGLVFDMDGLLLDSEKVVKRSWDYAGKELGYENFGDHIYNTVGFNLKRRTEYYYKIADKEGIAVKKGAPELLNAAKSHGCMIGLATSSRQIHAEQSLKRAGLYDYFDGKVFGDTVKEGKPSPEIYLKACKSIGIEPEDAVALEDAPSGAISAHAAGMRVIVVPDLVQPPEEVKQFLWKQAEDLERVIEMIWG
jgi:HAD superfamily hydrolase (TIGR01509 family)